MARVTWAEDKVVNIKLRDDLYTIGLLKRSPYMWIFDIYSETGEWTMVDLNKVKPLVCVGIVQTVMQKLVVGRLVQPQVIPPASLPMPLHWIKLIQNTAHWEVDNFPWRGGKLIALDPNIGSLDSPTVKEKLILPDDRELVESCELTLQWAFQDLGDRLRRYFDTGVNRDDMKFEVFPGLWNDREKLRPLTSRLPVPLR